MCVCVHYLYIHVHTPRTHTNGVCVVYARVCIGNAHTHTMCVCALTIHTLTYTMHTHTMCGCVCMVYVGVCVFSCIHHAHIHIVYVCEVYARVCIGTYVNVLHRLANNERVLSQPNAAETIMVKRLTHHSRYSIINTLCVCITYTYTCIHHAHTRKVCAWCMSCMYRSCTHAQYASVCITYTYTTHAHSCVWMVYARVCIGMYVFVVHSLAKNERVLSRPNVVGNIMVKRLTYTITRTRFSTLSRRICWKRRTYILGVWGTADIHQ